MAVKMSWCDVCVCVSGLNLFLKDPEPDMDGDFVLPRAGSAHSLYSSGVQYGASPAAKATRTHINDFFLHSFFLKRLQLSVSAASLT